VIHELYAQHWRDYELLDSGGFAKLERFGPHILHRPEPQALWQPVHNETYWKKADAVFTQKGSHSGTWDWRGKQARPANWHIQYHGPGYNLKFKLALTAFKHVGIFPEQAANWDFLYRRVTELKAITPVPKVLNLFAYTGGATLAARAAGADATHLDSVKQVVSWAAENLKLSSLDGARWIVEDAAKFVQREVRRGSKYQGIILDPPSFGHGAGGERWKLEDMLDGLLADVGKLLDPAGATLILNCYSLGLSPLVLERVVQARCGALAKHVEIGELYIAEKTGRKLPTGVYARF
jgi:23S rRNA (cytosine1962-C5)-methyltransferase